MKLLLPVIFLLIFFFVLAPQALAANLEVSDRSDFATAVRNFSGGQTIYVRINSGPVGAVTNSKLNLRNNQYAILNSFSLTRDGNYFSVIIPAPYTAGYYSLEAKVESAGNNITSVKTIKVGSPTNSSVKVNVENKVEGQRVTSTSKTTTGGDETDKSEKSPTPSPEISQLPQTQALVESHTGFWASVGNFFKKFWRFVFRG